MTSCSGRAHRHAHVPGAAELLHRQAGRHIADHLHHIFPRQMAILFYPSLLGSHCLQDQVFFGVHDGQQIPQAARGVLTGINVNMKPAAGIDDRPGMAQRPHDLLQFTHLGVFQHRRVEFDFVSRASGWFLTPANTLGGLDTAVIDEPPRLAVRVLDLPGVIQAGFAGAARRRAEESAHRLGGLLPGDPRHLDLTAKLLVAEVKGQRFFLRSALHPPPPACGQWLPPQ